MATVTVDPNEVRRRLRRSADDLLRAWSALRRLGPGRRVRSEA